MLSLIYGFRDKSPSMDKVIKDLTGDIEKPTIEDFEFDEGLLSVLKESKRRVAIQRKKNNVNNS